VNAARVDRPIERARARVSTRHIPALPPCCCGGRGHTARGVRASRRLARPCACSFVSRQGLRRQSAAQQQAEARTTAGRRSAQHSCHAARGCRAKPRSRVARAACAPRLALRRAQRGDAAERASSAPLALCVGFACRPSRAVAARRALGRC
jgi:hypothetical protein